MSRTLITPASSRYASSRIRIATPDILSSRKDAVVVERNRAREFAQAIKYGVTPDTAKAALQDLSVVLKDVKTSVVNVLPLLFNLEQRPFTLDRHFFLEPFFSTYLAADTVVCAARQIGKCAAGDTLVYTRDGEQKTLKEIVEQRADNAILAYDEAQSAFVPARIVNYFNTGRRRCAEITTRTGRTITTTFEHKYLTPDGWRALADMAIGECLAVPKRLDYFGDTEVTLDEAACIGYLTADGCLCGSGIQWIKADIRLVDDFTIVCCRFGWELRKGCGGLRYDVVSGGAAQRLCSEFGIHRKKSVEKIISPLILTAPKPAVARFLQVLISSDGSFCRRGKNRYIEYSSASQVMVRQVQSLLTRFGIASRFRYRQTKNQSGKKFDSWDLLIASEDHIKLFLAEIGWLRDVPEPPTHEQSKSFLDIIPAKVVAKLYQELQIALPEKDAHGRDKGIYEYFGVGPAAGLRKRISSGTPIMRQKLLNLRQHPIVDKYLNADILWDEIVAIKDVGEQDTYDLEVETHHNYVANNLITHNSLSGLSAPAITYAFLLPHMRILTVTPLFEQIRRISQNYVKPLIATSPVKSLMMSPSCTDAILQRDFINGSILYFSYAFTSVTRCRGIAADAVQYDELDDFDPEYPPIISQCASSAMRNRRFFRRFGTPKTLDTLMAQHWAVSSQAEWHIRCSHCGHWNIPSLDCDLDVMIGPRVPKWKVCAETPGIICAGKSKVDGTICGKPLHPQQGMWIHGFPERRFETAGYHVPQIILPQHCEDNLKWKALLNYREGAEGMTPSKFYNEICGIPYDGSSRLITLTELRRACSLPLDTTKLHEAAKWVERKMQDGIYYDCVMGVDWGGGGKKELSFTTICIACLRYDRKIDIVFGYRSLTPHDHEKEIATIIALRRMFQCSRIVHDGNGAGEARETQLTMCGVPSDAFSRMFYVRLARGSILKWNAGDTRIGTRSGHNLDKARSLMWLISLIKNDYVHFFRYDTVPGGKLGLVDDFLSLIEDKHSHDFASDVYTIIRSSSSKQPDDFTAACNYAVHYFYGVYLRSQYPNLDYLRGSNVAELDARLIEQIEGDFSDADLLQ